MDDDQLLTIQQRLLTALKQELDRFRHRGDQFDEADMRPFVSGALHEVRDRVREEKEAEIEKINTEAFMAEGECERWKAIAEMREQNLRSIEQRVLRDTLQRVLKTAEENVNIRELLREELCRINQQL